MTQNLRIITKMHIIEHFVRNKYKIYLSDNIDAGWFVRDRAPKLWKSCPRIFVVVFGAMCLTIVLKIFLLGIDLAFLYCTRRQSPQNMWPSVDFKEILDRKRTFCKEKKRKTRRGGTAVFRILPRVGEFNSATDEFRDARGPKIRRMTLYPFLCCPPP